MKFLRAALFALLLTSPATAQQSPVTAGAYAIGRGPGVSGYTSLLCSAGQLAVGQAGAPICRTVSGDWTLNAAGVSTLATVNANVGAFGSATQSVVFTVNAKGLITAAANVTVTPAVGSITGLGTGVAAALAINVGSAGAPVVFNGALGTPSSGSGANLTSLNATQLTSGIVPNARYNLTILPELRISYTTAVPVLTAAVTGATSFFVTPYSGNLVPIYDGTNFTPTAFAETSQAATDATKSPAATAASKIYNIYCWVDSGTNRCTRGAAWTNDTTPSETLVRVNGVLLNNASITNGPAAQRGTYMGVIRSDGSSTFTWSPGAAASGGTVANLTIWNMYNRVQVVGQPQDSGTAYTYTSATVRQARASAGNQVNILVGIQEETAIISYTHREQTAVAVGAALAAGIGLDTTTTYSAAQNLFAAQIAAAISTGATAGVQWQVPQGFHFVSANENSDGTNANTFDHGLSNQLFVSMRM